jgi:RNA-binding protein NOB1
MRLTRVKRFRLLCKGCNWLNSNTDALFCQKCGTAALAKVSVYVNANGEVTYFNNPKRKINLKGTIYSIPNPKGGRGCKDLILREDDLYKGEYRQMAQKI